jgi:glycosyltransferase involved in cell wall biosynthesis
MGNESNKKPIVVTGFPYAFPYYFKVFEYLQNKNDFVFVLPKFWIAKKGKMQFKLEPKVNFPTYGLKAVSYGGHSFRGLFKGWLPGIFFLLPRLKSKYHSKILYSCSEPSLLTTLYNSIAAKIFGFKHVLFTWQNVTPKSRMRGLKLRLSNTIVKLNLRLADGVICGNKKAELIIKEFNKNIRTIICPIAGVDIEKFKPSIASDWREKLRLSPDQKLILFYGALDARKGLDDLLKSMSRLPSTGWHLLIVGAGPKREELLKLVHNLGLQQSVTFIDWMKNDELPALLNAADIFVYPSVPSGGWQEQFGYAMAEASACQVPVVATHTGSIDEVVADGRSGILVRPNDPEELAQAITRLVLDDNLRRRTGEYGRKFVTENFSHQVVASKIEKFLNGFLGQQPAKRVMLAIHDIATGGSEKTIVTEANLLYERGYEVKLVTMLKNQHNDLARLLKIPPENFINFYFKSYFDFGEIIKLIIFLKQYQPDAIISASLFTNTILKFTKIFYPRPALIIREGNVFVRHGWRSRLFDRLTNFLVKKYFCNSQAIKEDMVRSLGLSANKIEVIYNGITPEAFDIPLISKEDKRKELGISQDAFVLLNVGSMSTLQKGQEYIIEALTNLRQDKKILVIFAGDGHRMKELQELAEKLGVTERIIFLGNRSDVRELQIAADVFVLPSLWEGMPNAMFDAMAAGMPVIATAVGGVPEILEDEKSGLIVAVKDPELIATAVARLKRNPELRTKLSQNARKAVSVEKLTWQYHIEKLSRLISQYF